MNAIFFSSAQRGVGAQKQVDPGFFLFVCFSPQIYTIEDQKAWGGINIIGNSKR